MMNKKHTRRALFASILSVVVCCAMLIGSTFAWFTDNVTSGNNNIQSGKLNVELEYRDGDTWKPVTENTKLFQEQAIWEPGHTEVVYLKVKNAGNLALSYKFGIAADNETTFTNALGETGCKLSDYLVFGCVESDTEIPAYTSREDAWKAAGETQGLSAYTREGELYPQGTTGKASEQYVALVVYMPAAVGNEANYRGEVVPSIDLGVKLAATQHTYEEDSFGSDYDGEAYCPDFRAATAEELKDAFANVKDGDIIEITNDITVSSRIDVKEDVIIDLGDHTITASRTEPFKIAGDGVNAVNVTVKADAGGIKVAGQSNECFYIGDTDGMPVNLTIDGGTYGSEKSEFFDIWDDTPANVNIKNVSYSGYRGIRCNHNGAVVNVNVADSVFDIKEGYSAVYAQGSVVCNLENVTLTAASESGSVRGFSALSNGNFHGAIYVCGGSYSSDGWLFNTNDGCTISVSGGTFSENPKDYLADGCTSVKNGDGTYTVTAN